MKPMTYEDVAQLADLDARTTRRFLRYMRGRSWRGEETTHCQTGYAREWARRFKDGVEYQRSDFEGQALLDVIDDEEKRR